MTKQLTPRTFSPISAKISPSENVVTSAAPSGTSTQRQMASASGRLAFPEKIVSALIIRHLNFAPAHLCGSAARLGRKDSNLRMRDRKSRDLPLVDAPVLLRYLRKTTPKKVALSSTRPPASQARRKLE